MRATPEPATALLLGFGSVQGVDFWGALTSVVLNDSSNSPD